MSIRYITYRIFALFALSMLVACSEDENILFEEAEGVEMKGVVPTMTRAGVSVPELEDYVGKKEFANNDRAVFVSIKRTSNPISQFTYQDIEFVCSASTTADGVTSIGWSRDKDTGTGGGNARPDRIYWSDATHEHTFIGYCAPQQGEGASFDWKKPENSEVYYGSIGDPTNFSTDHPENNVIDFRSTFDGETESLSGNVALCKNDILLTYSTSIKASDAIAKLQFYHGLAQVRVIVNISDFAAGGGDDTKSTVSNMILEDMLTMYKWCQLSARTEQLVGTDQNAINGLYSGYSVSYDQRKSVNLWIPQPKGVGEKSSRTFTFYGLAVPTAITETSPLQFSFTVQYPDPMKPEDMKSHTYKASIKDIQFDAGKCTTINISLNHKNEKMTVAAEYDDWEFIDTPDEGQLKKNGTFLDTTERSAVTILGDEKATVDDATWLYVDTKDNKIKDVYGNDGSKEHPFQISTALQLLSFAYEVKGGTDAKPRVSTNYKDLKDSSKTLSGAFDFTDYYVALDAGLTLQATEKKTRKELEINNPNIDKSSGSAWDNAPSAVLSWIGIGDTGKPFNGQFSGGVRQISRLYGSPFFIELGSEAHVGQLILEDVIDVIGDGGFVEKNSGVICACKMDGNVTSESNNSPVGSFVGTNAGLIFACYHIGDLTAKNASVVGGLVGENTESGKIVASYNFGKITTQVTDGPSAVWKYGVLGKGTAESVYGCFYDHTKASNVSNVAPSTTMSSSYPSLPMPTVDMIRKSFAGDKDATIQTFITQQDVNNYNAALLGAVKVGDPLEYTQEQFSNLTSVEISKDMFEFFNCFGYGFGYDEYVATLPATHPPFSNFTDEDIITLLTALKKECKHNEVSANAFNAKLPGAKKVGDIKNLSLNAIINSWTTEYQDAIANAQGEEWKTHYATHYYVAQPANYPYVY